MLKILFHMGTGKSYGFISYFVYIYLKTVCGF